MVRYSIVNNKKWKPVAWQRVLSKTSTEQNYHVVECYTKMNGILMDQNHLRLFSYHGNMKSVADLLEVSSI